MCGGLTPRGGIYVWTLVIPDGRKTKAEPNVGQTNGEGKDVQTTTIWERRYTGRKTGDRLTNHT